MKKRDNTYEEFNKLKQKKKIFANILFSPAEEKGCTKEEGKVVCNDRFCMDSFKQYKNKFWHLKGISVHKWQCINIHEHESLYYNIADVYTSNT